MNRFLTYCPSKRITAEDALKHDYFKESPLPVESHMFPTWPAKSEVGIIRTKHSPKPPSGGRQYKLLGDADGELAADSSTGFHMNLVGGGFSLKF